MNSEGVGFGLMISKALIEANGGVLKIASDGINKGSVFQFSMDMQDPGKSTNNGNEPRFLNDSTRDDKMSSNMNSTIIKNRTNESIETSN